MNTIEQFCNRGFNLRVIHQWQLQRLLLELDKPRRAYRERRAFWFTDGAMFEGHFRMNGSVSKAGRLSNQTVQYYEDTLFCMPHTAVAVRYHGQVLVVAFWSFLDAFDIPDLETRIGEILNDTVEDTFVNPEGRRADRPLLYMAADRERGI